MVADRRLAVAEIARRLGVSEGQLHDWRKAFRAQGPDAFPGRGRLAPQDEELHNLHAEVVRLKAERDVLPLNTLIAFFDFSRDFLLFSILRDDPASDGDVATGRRILAAASVGPPQMMLYVADFGFGPRFGGGAWTSWANVMLPASSRMRRSPTDHSSGVLAVGNSTRVYVRLSRFAGSVFTSGFDLGPSERLSSAARSA
jgi:transposase